MDQLPNGGAVVAVIAVVVLFLKEQARSHESIKVITEAFAAETRAARAEYREHVDSIMHLGLDAHSETRAAIRNLDATLGGLKEVGTPNAAAPAAPRPKPTKEAPR